MTVSLFTYVVVSFFLSFFLSFFCKNPDACVSRDDCGIVEEKTIRIVEQCNSTVAAEVEVVVAALYSEKEARHPVPGRTLVDEPEMGLKIPLKTLLRAGEKWEEKHEPFGRRSERDVLKGLEPAQKVGGLWKRGDPKLSLESAAKDLKLGSRGA